MNPDRGMTPDHIQKMLDQMKEQKAKGEDDEPKHKTLPVDEDWEGEESRRGRASGSKKHKGEHPEGRPRDNKLPPVKGEPSQISPGDIIREGTPEGVVFSTQSENFDEPKRSSAAPEHVTDERGGADVVKENVHKTIADRKPPAAELRNSGSVPKSASEMSEEEFAEYRARLRELSEELRSPEALLRQAAESLRPTAEYPHGNEALARAALQQRAKAMQAVTPEGKAIPLLAHKVQEQARKEFNALADHKPLEEILHPGHETPKPTEEKPDVPAAEAKADVSTKSDPLETAKAEMSTAFARAQKHLSETGILDLGELGKILVTAPEGDREELTAHLNDLVGVLETSREGKATKNHKKEREPLSTAVEGLEQEATTEKPMLPVVLVGGYSMSEADYAEEIARLTSLGYEVHYLNPDEGAELTREDITRHMLIDKEKPFPDLLMQKAKQVWDSLNELGITQAHVIGHSQGGSVAAAFAQWHPEMVRKLIMVNPVGMIGEDAPGYLIPRNIASQGADRKRSKETGKNEERKAFKKRAAKSIVGKAKFRLGEDMQSITRTDITPLLRELKNEEGVEVTLLTAKGDKLFPDERVLETLGVDLERFGEIESRLSETDTRQAEVRGRLSEIEGRLRALEGELEIATAGGETDHAAALRSEHEQLGAEQDVLQKEEADLLERLSMLGQEQQEMANTPFELVDRWGQYESKDATHNAPFLEQIGAIEQYLDARRPEGLPKAGEKPLNWYEKAVAMGVVGLLGAAEKVENATDKAWEGTKAFGKGAKSRIGKIGKWLLAGLGLFALVPFWLAGKAVGAAGRGIYKRASKYTPASLKPYYDKLAEKPKRRGKSE